MKRTDKKLNSAFKNSSEHAEFPTQNVLHPIFRQKLTIGQCAADMIARFGGSWRFMIFLIIVLVAWLAVNAIYLSNTGFDPYPFILLNLILSTLAAFQAPVILMAQNRQTERDRIDAKYDHAVNRKAEREIQQVKAQLKVLEEKLNLLKGR